MSDKLKQQAMEFLDDFEGVPETRNLYGVRTMIETLIAELDRYEAIIERQKKQIIEK